jgi:uncharacterized protein
MRTQHIEVRTNNKGRGVYALHPFSVSATIETCPVIIIEPEVVDFINSRRLGDYYFTWDNPWNGVFALGYGALYNHSFTPNARYYKHYDRQQIEFRAIKPIRAGEEITVNYNGDPDDQTPTRFEIYP